MTIIIGFDVSQKIGFAMKFALESLPELIGERDLHDLVEALGVTEEYLAIRDDGEVGRWLAGKIINLSRSHRQSRSVTSPRMF